MVAAPLRRGQDKNARGLIERVAPIAPPVGRCRRLQTAYLRPGEAGSRLSKPPWRDFRTPSSVGSVGQDDELAELRKRTALSQMARALSDDVRWRGI